MPGRRAASIDLPLPGGPTMRRWWRPAAAISSARLAFSWPLTSARSLSDTASGTVPGWAGASTARPVKWLTSARSVFGAITSTAPTQAASGAAGGGADQAAVGFGGGERRRQRADHRDERAVERELAQRHLRGHLVRGQDLHGGEERERDRQVEVRAFLGEVGGGEVDGDPLRGQREAHGGHRRAHPLLGLADRLVGEADEVEGRQAGGDGALHLDEARLHALKCHRVGARDHDLPGTFVADDPRGGPLPSG